MGTAASFTRSKQTLAAAINLFTFTFPLDGDPRLMTLLEHPLSGMGYLCWVSTAIIEGAGSH